MTAPPCVPLPLSERISVRDASAFAGVSGQTIRNWCDDLGIGKRPSGVGWISWQYAVSLPALRMVLEKDWEALEAFRLGDRSPEIVGRYMRTSQMTNKQDFEVL